MIKHARHFTLMHERSSTLYFCDDDDDGNDGWRGRSFLHCWSVLFLSFFIFIFFGIVKASSSSSLSLLLVEKFKFIWVHGSFQFIRHNVMLRNILLHMHAWVCEIIFFSFLLFFLFFKAWHAQWIYQGLR